MGLRRVLVKMLDPAGNADGNVVVLSGGKATWGTVPFDTESTIDAVAAALVAGTNMTITYNDPAGTITLAASGGSGSVGTGMAGWYAGNYYSHPAYNAAGATGAALPVAGTFAAHPVVVPDGSSIDQIATECTATGAGAVLRLGIYNSDSTGKLNNLLASGSVDASATGARTCSVSLTGLAGGVYWVAYLVATAAGTWRSWSSPSGVAHMGWSSALLTGTAHNRLQAAGVSTGSMPASAPAGLAPTSSGTASLMMRVRAA